MKKGENQTNETNDKENDNNSQDFTPERCWV